MINFFLNLVIAVHFKTFMMENMCSFFQDPVLQHIKSRKFELTNYVAFH